MYVIIDIETTGGNSRTDRITEIAIYKHDGTRVVDEFVTLVNPECRIPYYISELTGINDSMVAHAPKFYEVARRVVEITEGCIFVAHNAKFDYHFIRNEFKALGYDYRRKTLCTVQLSRKYLPGHKSYSLGKLCKALGIDLTRHHRAAADASATVDLFEMLLEKDGNQFRKRTATEKKIIDLMADHPLKERVLQLPEKPGVYYFFDAEGTLVYVGKSKNLRSRVLTHLANYTTQKAVLMREAVARIEYAQTGTELLALLKESAEIKKYKPIYNAAQRRSIYSYGLFAEHQLDGYLHLRVGKISRGEQPITTFTSMMEGKGYAERLMHEFHLCQRLVGLYGGTGACFNHSIKECRGACVGAELPEDYNERAQQAISAVRYHEPSFMIVDKGRTEQERSVVLVCRHNYRGFGFVPAEQANDLDALQACIQSQPDNREVQQIIRGYLERNEVEKLIPLPAEALVYE